MLFDIFIDSLYDETEKIFTLISQRHKTGEVYKYAGCQETGELI